MSEKKKELSAKERRAIAMQVCKRINCAPRHIFDLELYALFNNYYLVPQHLEKLLEQRGYKVKDDESLRDKVADLFGEETAEMLEALI